MDNSQRPQPASLTPARPRCGCKVNAPEADSRTWPCPCGDHCTDPNCRNMARHTSGPWRVGRDIVSDDFHSFPNTVEVCAGPKGNTTYIALVDSAAGDSIDDECRANARLIASAPDLLAERDRLKATNAELVRALERVTGIAEQIREEGLNPTQVFALRHLATAWCPAARAALAAARGGKS